MHTQSICIEEIHFRVKQTESDLRKPYLDPPHVMSQSTIMCIPQQLQQKPAQVKVRFTDVCTIITMIHKPCRVVTPTTFSTYPSVQWKA